MQSSTGRRKLEQMLPLLLLSAAVVTALVLGRLLSGYLGPKITGLSIANAAEYRACVLWGSSFIAFMVIAAWLVAVAGEWLADHQPAARRWMAPLAVILIVVGFVFRSANLPSLIGIVVIGGVLVMIVSAAGPRFLFAGIVAGMLFLAALACRLSGGGRAPSLLDKLDHAGVPVFDITFFGNTTAVVAIAFVIAACISIIARIQAAKGPVELRALLDTIRLLLYSSAVFLVVGVIEIYLLWDWPSHLSGQLPEVSTALHQMAQAVASMCGTLYSLMLLILFVPLSLMHERRSRELGSGGERKSALTMFAELIALAGPMITAFGIPKLFLP